MWEMVSEFSVTTELRQLRQIQEKCPVFGHFSKDLAPQVRLELTTLRLTAECSAIELLRNAASDIIAVYGLFRKGENREL